MTRILVLFLLLAVLPAAALAQEEELETMPWKAYDTGDLTAMLDALDRPYLEFLVVNTMKAGVYGLAAGSKDTQSPHAKDEFYVVLEGKAQFQCGDAVTPVRPGTLLYVRAGEPHKFLDIEEDLKVLVIFSEQDPASD